VLGKYKHRQATIQEVRFVITDKFKDRWKNHRLRDFNAHLMTSFEEVQFVLDEAIVKVERKLTL